MKPLKKPSSEGSVILKYDWSRYLLLAKIAELLIQQHPRPFDSDTLELAKTYLRGIMKKVVESVEADEDFRTVILDELEDGINDAAWTGMIDAFEGEIIRRLACEPGQLRPFFSCVQQVKPSRAKDRKGWLRGICKCEGCCDRSGNGRGFAIEFNPASGQWNLPRYNEDGDLIFFLMNHPGNHRVMSRWNVCYLLAKRVGIEGWPFGGEMPEKYVRDSLESMQPELVRIRSLLWDDARAA